MENEIPATVYKAINELADILGFCEDAALALHEYADRVHNYSMFGDTAALLVLSEAAGRTITTIQTVFIQDNPELLQKPEPEPDTIAGADAVNPVDGKPKKSINELEELARQRIIDLKLPLEAEGLIFNSHPDKYSFLLWFVYAPVNPVLDWTYKRISGTAPVVLA